MIQNDIFSDLQHESILRAVESTGVRCTGRLVQLNSMENRVYSVEIETPGAQKNTAVVAKFYRPKRWDRSQLLGEHALAKALHVDGLQTPGYKTILDPALRVDDSFLWNPDTSVHSDLSRVTQEEKLHTLGKTGDFHFCVWEKISGRAPLEVSPEDLQRIGRIIARMHNLFERKFVPDRLSRPRLSTELWLLNPLSDLESWGKIPRNFESQIFDLGEKLLEGLSWFDDCVSFLPIHGDLHRLNLVQTDVGGDYWIVDFDDCVLGPEVQDLWLFASTCDISGFVSETETKSSLDFLLEGYNQLRRMPQGSEALVEPLRTMRMFYYIGWIAKRWKSDEMFRTTFGFFESERFWEQTFTDLEEQYVKLEQEGLLDFGH